MAGKCSIIFIALFLLFCTGFHPHAFCASSEAFKNGVYEYKAGAYRKALESFLDVSLREPGNTENKEYVKKAALKLLEEEGRTSRKTLSLMEEAKRVLREIKKEKAAALKKYKPLVAAARSDYRKKNFLYAADTLSTVLLDYPDYEAARELYEKILYEMKETAEADSSSDLESVSYAQGFIDYREDHLTSALNEWKKILEMNPGRNELKEYLHIVEIRLKDKEEYAREKLFEEELRKLLDTGISEYTGKNWIACIKTMEKVQDKCKNKTLQKYAHMYDTAHEYIIRSVKELSLTVRKTSAAATPRTPLSPAVEEIDEAGAEKRYKEGLIFYAQGKAFEAVKSWEIAVRLNPKHEKALKALENVKDKENTK